MAVTITPEELAKSAHTFRNDLLSMPTIGLKSSLQHMALRPGIQYKQTVGEISDDSEIGPYDPQRRANDSKINGRTIEVFLGSVIKDFDPNVIFQSIYGSLILKGEGLKNVPITKAILGAMMKSISRGLNRSLFTAVQNSSGTKSKDLFNGFDTIAKAEMTAGTISVANNNLFEFTDVIDRNNAVELLKTYYRAGSDELKDEPVKMFIPKTIMEYYEDDYQQTVGSVVYNKSFEKRFLEGSNGLCELVPLPNKKDAEIIQITKQSNMLVGTGNGSDLESIDVGKYQPLLVSLTAVLLFGTQYETISPERLLIGKLATA